MSGGTDSSVAAALLAEQGYEVIGLTAHMWKEGSRCCSLEDVTRAQKVCAALGIRHYVVNAQDRFEKHVVSPFVDGYVAGVTPSPCISCNQFIKFGFLLDRAALMMRPPEGAVARSNLEPRWCSLASVAEDARRRAMIGG